MIKLAAPYATPMTITLLRNPDLNNEEGLDLVVDHRRAMDGTRYTYVKSSDKRRLSWGWTNIDRGKMIEVLEFIYEYQGQEIQIVDWRGDVWRGYILTQPFELETNIKHSPCGEVRGEGGDFKIELLAHRVTHVVLGECDDEELVDVIYFDQLVFAEVL